MMCGAIRFADAHTEGVVRIRDYAKQDFTKSGGPDVGPEWICDRLRGLFGKVEVECLLVDRCTP